MCGDGWLKLNFDCLVYKSKTMGRMTNSKRFENATRASFEEVDVDKTGSLDYKELYIALLLFYDKLNAILPVHVEVFYSSSWSNTHGKLYHLHVTCLN